MYAEETAKEYIPRARKKVKSNFIARWLLKTLKNESVQEKESSNMLVGVGTQLSVGPQSIDQPERALQFTVYNANGGRVVETRRYDKKTDRNTNGLYVITNDQDFGHEIDKIITMEALR
jgi:hypothetical protein